MKTDDIKFNLKIFSIDLKHYELIGKTIEEVVTVITNNHKKHLFASKIDFDQFKSPLHCLDEKGFKFYSYCYNEIKNQNYWKFFLPAELSADQNFDLIEFSHVIFISSNKNLYCVTSGSGTNVIKKYLNHYFGIELYQHFASLNEDITITINTRGVTGNLSQRSNTYNYNQSIKDSLIYSEIPNKLKIVMRKELRNGIFKKFKLDDSNSIMEIGSYFSFRKKLNFKELKELISIIEKVQTNKKNYINLSLFNRVTESNILDDLRNKLIGNIIENIIMHDQPGTLKRSNFDGVEIVNSKYIEKFYECNSFKLHFYKHQAKKDLIINDRDNLYFDITKFIYDNLDNITDKSEILKKINSLSVKGIIDSKEVTFESFYNQIVTELSLGINKYFRIDNNWFELDNNYLKQLREEAINNYEIYELKENLLNKWTTGDEDFYNKSHNADDYYIFDKKFSDNIELCDIMYYKDDEIYLIHVKNGFNTSMRNLSNQIVLSSQRLWNDINNVSGSTYLKSTIKSYNEKTPNNKLNSNILLKKMRDGDLSINIVMAYRYDKYINKTAVEKLKITRSNIALFSIVQTVREIQNFKNLKFHIIDISQV